MDEKLKHDYVVFHSQSDMEAAEKIHNVLWRKLGLVGVLRSDLPFNSNMERELEKAAMNCSIMFVLMSREFINNASKLFFNKARVIKKRPINKHIVPLIMKENKLLEALGILMQVVSFNINDENFELAMQDYIQTLNESIDGPLDSTTLPSTSDIDAPKPKRSKLSVTQTTATHQGENQGRLRYASCHQMQRYAFRKQ